jgi:tRNA 2-thiouridine synthesizing protein A
MKYELDTSGLLCPMPVIKLQNLANKLNHEDTVLLTATDPGTLHDIPTWSRINGHEVLEQKQQEQNYIFLVALRK